MKMAWPKILVLLFCSLWRCVLWLPSYSFCDLESPCRSGSVSSDGFQPWDSDHSRVLFHLFPGLFSFEDEWPATETASWHQAECFKKPRHSSDFIVQKRPWLLFIMIGWLSKQLCVWWQREWIEIFLLYFMFAPLPKRFLFRYLYFEKQWTN